VTLEDDALAEELAKLEGRRPDADTMRFARRLFARAVETPGGLKIDTIHAFCERILHMVPFEANVPARFAVLDEAKSAELLDAVTGLVLNRAVSDAGALGWAREIVSANAAGESFDQLIRQTVRQGWLFARENSAQEAIRRLRKRLRVPADVTPAGIVRAMLEDRLAAGRMARARDALQASSAITDGKQASLLRAAFAGADTSERLALYREIFFTDKGEPRASLATKKVDAALKERLADEQARLVRLDDDLKAPKRSSARRPVHAGCRNPARARCREGAARRPRFRRPHRQDPGASRPRRGRLGALQARSRRRPHPRGRGAGHESGAMGHPAPSGEDFTAGAGAAGGRTRTIFAVGDPKQSIYGFQGAEPRRFEESRQHWREAVTAAALPFEDVPLIVSFRSAKAVLSAVDATFALPDHFRGLSFDDQAVGTVHETVRGSEPGMVELWPVERPAEAEDPRPGCSPSMRRSASRHPWCWPSASRLPFAAGPRKATSGAAAGARGISWFSPRSAAPPSLPSSVP
jgi:ATP-dependent helicase/nuclease subunit A